MDQFFGIGLWELLMIAVIALVVLGPRQMIILSRKAGEYLRILNQMWQKASAEIKDQLDEIEDDSGGLVKELDALKDEVTKSVQSLQENFTIASPLPPNGSGQTPSPQPTTVTPSTSAASTADESKPEAAPESTTSAPPKPSYSAWVSKPKS
ncbi:MAG: twin-arginine translocase TatA/TatE family subunit [Chloroflexi bacterium]|nr:twin-arginine translocase TatA/TatE family subunit [Chloroflexota bacterium]